MIVVDTRERRHARKVIEYLTSRGVGIGFEKLEYGDYMLGHVLVERKTVGDLLNSLRSGRLWEQLDGLRRSCDEPLVVIEGSMSRVSRTGWSAESVMGLVASICFDWGVKLVPSASQTMTGALLYAIHKRVSGEKEGRRPVFKPKAETIDEMVLRIVSSLPGVSTSRAELLLRRFKTLRNLANAGVREVEEVKGIGEKIAAKIVEVFTHEWVG